VAETRKRKEQGREKWEGICVKVIEQGGGDNGHTMVDDKPSDPFLDPCEECFGMWKANFTRLQGRFPPASLDKIARTSLILLAGETITQDHCFPTPDLSYQLSRANSQSQQTKSQMVCILVMSILCQQSSSWKRVTRTQSKRKRKCKRKRKKIDQ
jgi:hypothetical protein